MHRYSVRTAAALLSQLVVLASGLMAQTDFEPGNTSEFPWDGVKKTPLLYFPENYARTPGESWPVIFHYHGTNGSPTVDLPRIYTGGRDFIIVGMPYITEGQQRPERDYLLQELELLTAIRKRLVTQFRADPKRCYVGGFSKGGWFASEYAESFMREFAGAYMIGAGWAGREKRPTHPINAKKPVYIGAGQFDDNHSHSVAAIRRFEELGASVTFEEYPAIGHQIPTSPPSEYLRQWFQIESHRPAILGLKEAVHSWAESKSERLQKMESPFEQYLFIQHLRSAPFYAYLSKTLRQPYDEALKTALAAKEVQTELAVRNRYNEALAIVTKAKSMNDKRSALTHCWSLYQNYPDSYYGMRAAVEALRLKSQITALNRWNWPTPEARQAFEDELKKNPLPDPDERALKESFNQFNWR